MKKMLFIGMALLAFPTMGMCGNLPPISNSASSKIAKVANETNSSIANKFLSVTYNSQTKSLEVVSLSTKKAFLKNVLPDGIVGLAKKKEIVSPAFGKGSVLSIATADGGEFTFTLYPSSPFLFVTQTVNNQGAAI